MRLDHKLVITVVQQMSEDTIRQRQSVHCKNGHYPYDPKCEMCIKGKLRQRQCRRREIIKTIKFGDHIHADLVGPVMDMYVLTAIDVHTSFGWVVKIDSKEAAEVRDALSIVLADIARTRGVPDGMVSKSDRGLEFTDGTTVSWMRERLINIDRSPPYRPQANGKVECFNGQIIRLARTLMLQANAPLLWWTSAMRFAAQIINVNGGEASPYFLRNGRLPPAIKGTFGCRSESLTLSPKKAKFESRTMSGIFVGFESDIDNPTCFFVPIQETDGRTLKVNIRSPMILADTAVYDDVSFPLKDRNCIDENGAILDAERSQEELLMIEQARFDETRRDDVEAGNQERVPRPRGRAPAGTVWNDALGRFVSQRRAMRTGQKIGLRKEILPDVWTTRVAMVIRDSPSNACQIQWLSSGKEDTIDLDSEDHDVDGDVTPNPNPSDMSEEQMRIAMKSAIRFVQDPIESEQEYNKLFVTKSVSVAYALKSDPEGAQKALDDERRCILDWETFEDISQPKEWDGVRSDDKDAMVAQMMIIMGIKYWELGPDFHKWKARFVGRGDIVKDADGNLIKEHELLYSKPVAMHTFRLLFAMASAEGLELEIGDMQTAFLQCPRKGADTWVKLPMEFLPEKDRTTWKSMKNPVVRLKKSLYGFCRSGYDLEQLMWKELEQLGWVHRGDNFFSKHTRSGNCYLVLYVDDILMAVPRRQSATEWSLIKQRVLIKAVESARSAAGARFLAIRQRIIRHDGPNGKAIYALDQREYAKCLVDNYEKKVGREIKTRKWPATVLSTADRIAELESPKMDGNDHLVFLGGLLYLMRGSRSDLVYSVPTLCRGAKGWTEAHERHLETVFGYVKGTLDFGIVIEVTLPAIREMRQFHIRAFCDADLGGDVSTWRSTSGGMLYLAIVEPRSSGTSQVTVDYQTQIPIEWFSKRQPTVSLPTTEAETAAVCDGSKRMLSLIGILIGIGGSVRGHAFTDSQALMMSVVKGAVGIQYSHISRALRLQWLTELYREGEEHVLHLMKSGDNVADIGTKPLVGELFYRHRENLRLRAADAKSLQEMLAD